MLYKLRGLKKTYGERTVLSIDTLNLERGKIYTLTGPNGAGKSTLLTQLALLDQPSQGTVEFMGERLEYSRKQLQRLRRQVVLLDQTPIMFSGTVAENVGYGLRVRKVAVAEQKQRIAEALDMVGLASFAARDAQALSGGECKRVALARALVLRPEVLICDEPSANVDSENQEAILHVLERMNREFGMTILFSTHYLSQGQRLADETLLLQNGTLSEMHHDNVYRVQCVSGDDGGRLCRLAPGLELPFAAADNSGKIWIDPSQVTIVEPREAPALASVQAGEVLELVRQNEVVQFVVDIGVRLKFYLPYREYRDHAPYIGQRVLLAIPQSALSFVAG